ncbi:MAG: hypothetical protein ACOC3E_02215 [Cyanobacteriota bacterium]
MLTSLDSLIVKVPGFSLFLAQTIEDPDVLGQMQDAWQNFIETGQVWALIIGFVFGFLFRSITAS